MQLTDYPTVPPPLPVEEAKPRGLPAELEDELQAIEDHARHWMGSKAAFIEARVAKFRELLKHYAA